MPIIQRSAVRAVSRASRMASRVARQNAAGLSTAARVAAPSLRSAGVPSIAKAMKTPGMYDEPPFIRSEQMTNSI